MTPQLSPYGIGWLSADHDDCPFTDEIDVVETISQNRTVYATDQWRRGRDAAREDHRD